jgi:hypothetical protein
LDDFVFLTENLCLPFGRRIIRPASINPSFEKHQLTFAGYRNNHAWLCVAPFRKRANPMPVFSKPSEMFSGPYGPLNHLFRFALTRFQVPG